MPRCQRTLRLLPGNPNAPVQSCPFCADRETYTQVTDADLMRYSQVAFATLARDFGRPADASVPVRLWHGLMAECVRGKHGYDLYLGGDADALQLRLQIGHEMFHRVCSQGRIFHWTHEMLACVFSVRLLRQCGFAAYADTMDAAYRQQAEALPLAHLMMADVAVPPYPAGLYGRAYVTGNALAEATGWPDLCRLTAPDQHGDSRNPDITSWQRRLPAATAAKAKALLAPVG